MRDRLLSSSLGLCLSAILVAGLEAAKDVEKPGSPARNRASKLEQYRARKSKLPEKNVDAHLELARWCEESGLKTMAAEQYRSVLRISEDVVRKIVGKQEG